MTRQDWESLSHFDATENWGDPDLMEFEFVSELDALRDFEKTRMVVSCGTQGKHARGSLHYIGRAADIVYPDCTWDQLLDRFLTALRFEFTEIGIYPDWRFDGRIVGGLHLGLDDLNPCERKFWIGVRNADGGNEYHAMTANNLIRFLHLGG